MDDLKGADGNDGAAGVDGNDGTDGTDGNDGAAGVDGSDGVDGREVEFQKSATHIQWRYVGDLTWTDLIALDDLKGADGNDGAAGVDGNDGTDGNDGAAGADALWNFTGAYNPGLPYAVGDVATYNGETWYRVNSNGGNVGDTPSEGAFWTRIAQKGLDGTDGGDGADGSEVELQKGTTHLQWRYVGGTTWTDLIALDDLKGADGADGSDGAAGDDGSEVELQKGTTHLQWRYVGGATWTNLVALDDLKGAAGSNGVNGRGYNLTFTSLNIDVSIGGKTLILGSMAQPSSSPNMVAALATAYSTGNRVRLSANSSTWIEGQMAIISPSGMYGWGLTVTKISGSGTYSTWNVSIAGEPGIDGVAAGHQHSAADITSGTLDIARIPVLPSQKQIVSSGGLAQLTTEQQGEIGQGTVVTTLDGKRWVYTGAGSKVAETSYIVLADITPEWSAIASKPSFVELASTSGVPDSQATPVSIYIDDFPDGISLNLNSSKVNGKNSYGPTAAAAGNYPNYTVTIQWNGTAWVMSYTSPYSNGARQFTASGDTLYPWQATWGTDSTGNYGGVEVNRVGTYTAALSAKPLAAEASSGIGAKAAREDHVHPLPTPADIGAAALSHTHPLSQLEQSSATNGQVPVWNATASAWGPATPVTSYTQLTDKPTLGTAAATDATAYATAAQGAKADTSLQLSAPILTPWMTVPLDYAKAATPQTGWGTNTLPRDWPSVIYANSKFYAISSTQVAISSDGRNWTLHDLPHQRVWTHIQYGGGKFVAIAKNWTIGSSPVQGGWMYSDDGINWSLSSSQFPSNSIFTGLVYGGDKFVAILNKNSGDAEAFHSANGIDWVSATVGGTSPRLKDIAYGGGRFVLVSDVLQGATLRGAAYSLDGINWTASNPLQNFPYSVCFANNQFYSVSVFSNSVVSSSDGVNWAGVSTLPSEGYGHKQIVYSAALGFFFVMGYSGNVYRSSDLTNWVNVTSGRKGQYILSAGDRVYNGSAWNWEPPLLQDIKLEAPPFSTALAIQTAFNAKLNISDGNYVIARPGDDIELKYSQAKTLKPNGVSPSNNNRAYLLIFPGTYSTKTQNFPIDAEFVDIVGLGAQEQRPAVIFNTGGYFNFTANDIRVSGIEVRNWNGTGSSFTIVSDKPLQVFENCVGRGSYGFVGSGGIASGTFINCVGGNNSFASNGTANGTFINCVGGNSSFGKTASGIFINCTGGGGSFGGGGTASGTFTGCTGGFESISVASGTFINCSGSSFPNLTAPATGKARMINCMDQNRNIIEGEV